MTRPCYWIQTAGGLGNQLFGVSYGRYLQEQTKAEIHFLRPSDAGSNTSHGQSLHGLSIFGSEVVYEEPTVLQTLRSRVSRWDAFGLLRVFNEGSKYLAELELPPNSLVRGYFQKLEPIEFLKTAGLFAVNFPIRSSDQAESLKSEIRSKEGIASLHIRFGDYLVLPEFEIDRAAYYLSACRRLLEERGEITTFYIFSDDALLAGELMSSVSKELPTMKLRIVDEKISPLETLEILTLFSDSIVANSTFSWWGAMLRSHALFTAFPDPWFPSGKMTGPEIRNDWTPIKSYR